MDAAVKSLASLHTEVRVKAYYRVRCSVCGSSADDSEVGPKLLIITDDSVLELFLRLKSPWCQNVSCNFGKLIVVYGPDPSALARVMKYKARKLGFTFLRGEDTVTNLTVRAVGIEEAKHRFKLNNRDLNAIRNIEFHPTHGVAGPNTFEQRDPFLPNTVSYLSYLMCVAILQ